MRAQEFVTEAVNPDILNPKFQHKQEIGDFTYTASVQQGKQLAEPYPGAPVTDVGTSKPYYIISWLKIRCFDGNKRIGSAVFEIHGNKKNQQWLESYGTSVDKAYEGTGIASTMYAYAKMLGNDIKPSSNLSFHGQRMWAGWKKSGEAKHLTKMSTPVTELFEPGKPWRWSFQGSEEAVAVFQIGEVPYMFHAYGSDGEWEAEFKRHGSKLDRLQKFGLTGTGNSAEVMSTVVDIMRAFLEKYRDKIQVLTFSAKEDSRQGLYARMVKRLLPNWTMTQKDEFFTLVAPKQGVTENWGVEKFAIPLPIGDYLAGGSDEFAPPGNYKSAEDLHDEVFDLIDAGVEPDAATVNPRSLLATQDWLSNAGGDNPLFDEYPDRPVVYQKAGKLYILDGHHRTTRAWKAGRPISVYLFRDDQLRDELDENFADGKVKGKSRPGRVKRAGASCNGSVTDLRQRAKNASGERAKMYHWCANMKSGRNKNK